MKRSENLANLIIAIVCLVLVGGIFSLGGYSNWSGAFDGALGALLMWWYTDKDIRRHQREN